MSTSLLLSLFFLLCLSTMELAAQRLLLFDVDESSYPTLSAKFLAIDGSGELLRDLNAGDFVVTENGSPRQILSVSCPPPSPPVPLSSVLMIDVSGSMAQEGTSGESNMDIARGAARAWVEALPPGASECAVGSFDDRGYLNQDFTADRSRLLAAIDLLSPQGGTGYDAGLIDPPAGAIQIAGRGEHKRVVVFITDGIGTGTEEKIVQMARDRGVTVYCVTIGMPAPEILKNVAGRTGGFWYENVQSREEAEDIYRLILRVAMGAEPCTLQWTGGRICTPQREIVVEVPAHGLSQRVTAPVSSQSTAMLEFEPPFISFGAMPPGTTRDTAITITARNQPVEISSITTDDSRFTIVAGGVPPTRTLMPGESISLQVRFAPIDSGYALGALLVSSDACPGIDAFFSGGFPGMPATRPTLRITSPNGGEELAVGADTTITWSGIHADARLRLENSTDGGATWNLIDGSASGLRYRWKVPPTPSRRCLIRASQLPEGDSVISLTGHESPLADACFSRDGLWAATCGTDSTVRIWNARTGEQVQLIKPVGIGTGGASAGMIRSVEFDPDGLMILIGCDDGAARIYDWRSGTLIRRLGVFSGLRYGGCVAAYSRDGLNVALGHVDGTLQVYSFATGAMELVEKVHENPIVSIHFDPKGEYVATGGSYDRSVRIIHLASGEVLATITDPANGYARGGIWSPDGRTMAIVFDDVTMYDVTMDEVPPSFIRGRTIRSTVHSAFFSPNGRYIVTGNWAAPYGGTFSIYEAATGVLLREYVHNSDGGVYPVRFSYDNRRLISAGARNMAKIWDFDPLALQEDVSDSLWAIVTPSGSGRDLDLGEVVLGESRDSVVTPYLCNTGDVPFHVTGIGFEGDASADFSIVAGDAPFELLPGECRAVEFRFHPSATGERRATVVIATPGDTLRYAVRGVGVEQGLEATVKLIDFGGVALGDIRDTIVDVIIRNVGSSLITIESATLPGPDTEQFSILAGGGSFVLAAGEGRRMSLRFAPRRAGRTMARVSFSFAGGGSPLQALLFGEGLCPAGGGSHTLSLGEATGVEAAPGEVLSLPLLLREPAGLPPIEGEYSMLVRFNRRLLLPLDSAARLTIIDGDTLFRYTGSWNGSSDTLMMLQFLAALGNAEETELMIESFTWEWGCPIDIRRDDPRLRIRVCRDGENPRLFLDDWELVLKPLYPNPAADLVSVEFSTIERGRTELYLVDPLGRRAATIVDAELATGNHTVQFDVSDLPSGAYHCVLRTSTQQISTQVVVQR